MVLSVLKMTCGICHVNVNAEYIMRRALVDWDRSFSVGDRRISNLRYAYDTTLLARNATDLKDLFLKV